MNSANRLLTLSLFPLSLLLISTASRAQKPGPTPPLDTIRPSIFPRRLIPTLQTTENQSNSLVNPWVFTDADSARFTFHQYQQPYANLYEVHLLLFECANKVYHEVSCHPPYSSPQVTQHIRFRQHAQAAVPAIPAREEYSNATQLRVILIFISLGSREL